MEAYDVYLSEQCQKQGLVYIPGAGVFDENGALFIVSETTGLDVELSHPKFVDLEAWHSMYVNSTSARVYSSPDPKAETLPTKITTCAEDLPDLRELSRVAGEAEVGND